MVLLWAPYQQHVEYLLHQIRVLDQPARTILGNGRDREAHRCCMHTMNIATLLLSI
jgi:hypothetical protein